MARQRYQSGCLFKRGRRRKVWVARWRDDVILADGSRGRVHRSVVLGLVTEMPSRRMAQARLEERLRKLNHGLQGPLSVMRFREYVEGQWTSLSLPMYKLSTQHGYRVTIGRHLLPYFGDSKLSDITRLEIQQFVAEKFRQGLAWQTVRNAWIVLSSILDSAVEYGYLTLNPARGIKFPPKDVRSEPRVLGADELARLLRKLGEPYTTMVALTALTGLRIGELLALRWGVLDLRHGTLRVAESVFQGNFQRPKSAKAMRTIPLGPTACARLEAHRLRSALLTPESLVFPKTLNTPYRESNLLQDVLQPAARAAGIGHVTWHQLRHAHASLLHDLGVPVKIAQKQLGHATVETTLNVYTHTIPETHRRAMEQLERVLFPNVPKLEESGDGEGTVIQ